MRGLLSPRPCGYNSCFCSECVARPFVTIRFRREPKNRVHPLSPTEQRRVLRFFHFYARRKGLLNIWRHRPGRNGVGGLGERFRPLLVRNRAALHGERPRLSFDRAASASCGRREQVTSRRYRRPVAQGPGPSVRVLWAYRTGWRGADAGYTTSIASRGNRDPRGESALYAPRTSAGR